MSIPHLWFWHLYYFALFVENGSLNLHLVLSPFLRNGFTIISRRGVNAQEGEFE